MPGAGAGILKKALFSYRGITDAIGTNVTLMCAALATRPNYDGGQVVILDGNCIGQSRDVDGVTTGGVVTVGTAFDHAIASGVSFIILSIRSSAGDVIDQLLKLQRSTQSGIKTMTAAYATEFDDTDANPWMFMGSWIDLTNMQALDVVNIRLSAVGMDGGAYIVEDILTYTGVQPVGAKAVRIGAIPNVYGVRIEASQTAGFPPFLSLDMEFMVAKR